MWGLKVCSVSLRGLFMGWIELALKDFIDLIRMLLALNSCLENACQIRFTVAVYLDHYSI